MVNNNDKFKYIHFDFSKKAKLDGTKAIRGGVPVCFPQFGPWEFGAQHGFARISKDWKIVSVPEVDEISGDAKVITSKYRLKL